MVRWVAQGATTQRVLSGYRLPGPISRLTSRLLLPPVVHRWPIGSRVASDEMGAPRRRQRGYGQGLQVPLLFAGLGRGQNVEGRQGVSDLVLEHHNVLDDRRIGGVLEPFGPDPSVAGGLHRRPESRTH